MRDQLSADDDRSDQAEGLPDGRGAPAQDPVRAIDRVSSSGPQRATRRPRRRATGPTFSVRRAHGVAYLVPTPPAAAAPLADCLRELQRSWQRDNPLAALWQAWPAIAGPQLAPHCRPLALRGGILTVGAAPGPWLQALLYNRPQLLGALRGAGFAVRDLRLQQHHPLPAPPPGSDLEEDVWACHPCRIDVHGLADCPLCRRPAPAGELARWGRCGFCLLSVAPPGGEGPNGPA